jgi:hypothetical protein
MSPYVIARSSDVFPVLSRVEGYQDDEVNSNVNGLDCHARLYLARNGTFINL